MATEPGKPDDPEFTPVEGVQTVDGPLFPRQERLFPYENPLEGRFGKEFFRAIPKTPGVYYMIGVAEGILYVGKAKNLRARLYSYRRAKPEQDSRKVLRMLRLVQSIRWEECASEKDALLRENKLLRELKPSFNVVNTSPDSYYLVGLRWLGELEEARSSTVRFRLTCNPKPMGDLVYGAFKGRGTVRKGYMALLRLLWALDSKLERFEYPQKLTRRKPAYLYTLDIPARLLKPLKAFLNGTSSTLLVHLTETLLENESIPPWVYAIVQEDLESLALFYERCLRRNRLLRKNHKIPGRMIAQEAIDDVLVMELARVGKVAECLPGLTFDPAAEFPEARDLGQEPGESTPRALAARQSLREPRPGHGIRGKTR